MTRDEFSALLNVIGHYNRRTKRQWRRYEGRGPNRTQRGIGAITLAFWMKNLTDKYGYPEVKG